MKITVIGAGKMGLPLACQIANRGGQVIACDINPDLVAAINSGRMPFEEPGIAEILEEAVRSGALEATTSVSLAVGQADVVITIIPVLLNADREADLSGIESVTASIADQLRPGQMICYETTVPAGTVRLRLLPLLERSGLQAGRDFDLVFSPERVKSRFVLRNLQSVPKIVGGVNRSSADRGESFYRRFIGAPVINVGSLEGAEFSKIAGMVYRDVNIALANELAAYAESIGVNFHEIADAANTDGESALLSPGIGVGGHCTPVYPYFLLQDAFNRGVSQSLTSAARRINDRQAGRMLDRVEKAGCELRDREVLILGLGFRPAVKEHTLSPAFLIREEAYLRGANPVLHDPYYSADEIERHGFVPFDLEGPLPSIVVLCTAHPQYAQIDFNDWRRRGVRVVVDGRNLWNPVEVQDAAITYLAPGLFTHRSYSKAEVPQTACVE